MKRSKFTEPQIAFVLQQAEAGVPIAEVCRKAGISDATFYNWRKKFGGLLPLDQNSCRYLKIGPLSPTTSQITSTSTSANSYLGTI